MESREFVEIMKALNNINDEIKENRKETRLLRSEFEQERDENRKRWEKNEKRWEENDKRWNENDKRWEENDKRWKQNDKRWEENDKKWEEIHIDMARNKKDIENILWSFQCSIESMFENHENRIKRLEKICV